MRSLLEAISPTARELLKESPANAEGAHHHVEDGGWSLRHSRGPNQFALIREIRVKTFNSTKTKNMSLNMTKEYRRELKQLRKVSVKTTGMLARELRECDRHLAVYRKSIERRKDQAIKRTNRAYIKIDQRIAILEGRLA